MKSMAFISGLCLLFNAPAFAQMQFGLRLDAATSMQWNGPNIYVEANGYSAVHTSAKVIRDIWTGPLEGVFGVWASEGVGILVGNDVILGPPLIAGDLTLRSSTADRVYALRHNNTVSSEIVEIVSGGVGRHRLTLQRQPVDFDVDTAGNMVALFADGSITFAVDDSSIVEFKASFLQKPTRIFVDAGSKEIAVYEPAKLARFDTTTGTWSVDPVDEQKDALVRNVRTRRIHIERRLP